MYPSRATISSPTITSGPSRAFRVEEAMRSSRNRVVRTMPVGSRWWVVGGGPSAIDRGRRARARGRARTCREQLRNGPDPRERPGLVTGPEPILLAVGRHRAVHHREGASSAGHHETAGGDMHAGLAGHPLLGARDEGLDVPERRVEVVTLVEPVAVETAELILPEDLPLGERHLLQLAVRRDEQQGGAGLEADPALDAEGGLPDVNVAAEPVAGRELPEPGSAA